MTTCTCGEELEQDGDNDATDIDPDSCIHDFICSDYECRKTYKIHYAVCDMEETTN